MSINVNGLKEATDSLNKLANPRLFFDETVYRTAIKVQNDIIKTTPFNKNSPFTHTKNMWEDPKKLANSVYAVDNAKTTDLGKAVASPAEDVYNLATILNDGRKAIKPIRAKRLFIPFSRRAIQWYAVHGKTGKVFPKKWVFGVDYVFAKSAKAYPGTQFIDKAEKKGADILEKAMIKKLKGI